MRFSKVALSALFALVLSSLSEHNGAALVRAAEEEAATEEAAAAAAAAADEHSWPENAESFQFEAEVHRMLDIVVNSLYQNKDVFLRELISNASDALDKIRFLSLTKPDFLKDKAELEVRIQYDPEQRTLTVADSGIGMTHDELVENLGTVARSGTTKFMDALGEGKADVGMIGQFGVGFYSSFLVADRVVVASKHPDDAVQNVWESVNGQSDFHVYPDPRGTTLGRGTEITLYLKEDAGEYADDDKLMDLIKHYSEFVTHPIHLRTTSTMEVEVEDEEDEEDEAQEKKPSGDEDELEVKEDDDDDEEKEKEKKEPKMEEVTTHSWEQINTDPAIWVRSREEITDDDYQAFYKVVNKEAFENATTWIHFNAEGNINFRSILYLPDEIPQNLMAGDFSAPAKSGLRLYVKKVLISDEFDLMPRYLSFMKGVVDSDDLPLNVNRETLQESKIIQVIKKKLVRKAIDMMRKFSTEEPTEEEEVKEAEIDEEGNVKEPEDTPKKVVVDKYLEWYKKFAPSLKMGAMEDDANRGKLARLLRFQSSNSGEKYVGFEDYVKNMKEWQDEIYFFAGQSVAELDKSQFMERFKEKGVEVLYLTEPVDEYMIQQLREFDEKKFAHITKEGIKFKDEDEDMVKRRDKAYRKKFKPLTKWLKQLYGPNVMKINISKRLGSAPAIVSVSDWGHSANMERIMKAQAYQHGQDPGMLKAMRILEINPRHPLVLKLLEGAPPDEEPKEGEEPFKPDESSVDAAWMLMDMALLNGGFDIDDHEGYSKRMVKVLQSQLGVESLKLADEIDPPVEEDEPPEPDAENGGLNMDDFKLDLDGMDLPEGVQVL